MRQESRGCTGEDGSTHGPPPRLQGVSAGPAGPVCFLSGTGAFNACLLKSRDPLLQIRFRLPQLEAEIGEEIEIGWG